MIGYTYSNIIIIPDGRAGTCSGLNGQSHSAGTKLVKYIISHLPTAAQTAPLATCSPSPSEHVLEEVTPTAILPLEHSTSHSSTPNATQCLSPSLTTSNTSSPSLAQEKGTEFSYMYNVTNLHYDR